jgi:hypothetical protein
MRQRYISQCPAAKEESIHGVLLSGSLLRETERQYSDTPSDQRIAEPCHREAVCEWGGRHVTTKQWADGERAMIRRDSVRMAGEPYHGETAGGWRGILVFTSDRSLCSKAAELVVERRSIGRSFDDRLKLELDSAVWVRYWVRVASRLIPKRWLYKKRLICERLVSKILLQCALLIAALIIANVV